MKIPAFLPAFLIVALAAITMFVTTEASAAMHHDKTGAITIENPWARATMGSANTAAAYLTIKNHGATPDRLIAARSPVSKKAGVHQSLMENGVMKMLPVKALDVTAKGATTLEPSGYHIMFMGLKEPLKTGETFPLTLVFEKAGEVKVMVKVMKMGAMGAMGSMGGAMDGMGGMGMKPAQ